MDIILVLILLSIIIIISYLKRNLYIYSIIDDFFNDFNFINLVFMIYFYFYFYIFIGKQILL
jgi:hypothetical protein